MRNKSHRTHGLLYSMNKDEKHSLEEDRFPVIYSLSVQFIISISFKVMRKVFQSYK